MGATGGGGTICSVASVSVLSTGVLEEEEEGEGFNTNDSMPSGNALLAAAANGEVGNFDFNRALMTRLLLPPRTARLLKSLREKTLLLKLSLLPPLPPLPPLLLLPKPMLLLPKIPLLLLGKVVLVAPVTVALILRCVVSNATLILGRRGTLVLLLSFFVVRSVVLSVAVVSPADCCDGLLSVFLPSKMASNVPTFFCRSARELPAIFESKNGMPKCRVGVVG